jgi:hypothetical protein
MKSLWEFVKNYDEIATFSCYSRDCLDLHDNELELYNNHLLTQYHQYGTGIKRKYYDDLLKHLIEEYTSHTEPGMINDSYKRTKDLLIENKQKLDEVATELLKKETLYKEDLERILGKRVVEDKNIILNHGALSNVEINHFAMNYL